MFAPQHNVHIAKYLANLLRPINKTIDLTQALKKNVSNSVQNIWLTLLSFPFSELRINQGISSIRRQKKCALIS